MMPLIWWRCWELVAQLAVFPDQGLTFQRAVHHRAQHREIDGLVEEIVGAFLDGTQRVLALTQRRHQQHHDLRVLLASGTQHPEALFGLIARRHTQIEQYQLRLPSREQLDGRGPVAGQLELVVVLQRPAELLREHRIVLDHQHSRALGHDRRLRQSTGR